MNKIEVINLIKQVIKDRKEAEDELYRQKMFEKSESYQAQREDLEWCLELVKKIKPPKDWTEGTTPVSIS